MCGHVLHFCISHLHLVTYTKWHALSQIQDQPFVYLDREDEDALLSSVFAFGHHHHFS